MGARYSKGFISLLQEALCKASYRKGGGAPYYAVIGGQMAQVEIHPLGMKKQLASLSSMCEY